MVDDIDSLLECAIDAARAAGTHALKNHARRNETVSTEAHDVKLQLDIECQEIAEQAISARFPDHDILGEESPQLSSVPCLSRHSLLAKPGPLSSDYVWIVDPIDGTVNFSHGFIFWCTSIAVQHNGETVAAAVYAPALDEMFTASSSRQSMLNGKEIHVSETSELARAMVNTGMDRNPEAGHEPYAVFRAIAENTQKARITGSAALDICRVACGQSDGYFESDIYIWDVAAAGFIVRRAGGKAEILKILLSPNNMKYIATNGIIHDALKNLVEPFITCQ